MIDPEKIYRCYVSSEWNVDKLLEKKLITKKQLKKIKKKYDGGESHILGDPLIPGLYVNVGNGKCLGIRDLIGMGMIGKYPKNERGQYINPFTRQPYNHGTMQKINDLLYLAGLPKINHYDLKNINDFNGNFEMYSNYIITSLKSGRLSLEQQQEAITAYSSLLDPLYCIYLIFEEPQGETWVYHENRIYLRTPYGWMLPEHMGDYEWLNVST
uniref:Uncharacterized protein n=1 Tax=viral metagenome TaxID=1070528 RepID=A0A6C0I922_9ZZZZ